MNDKSFVGLKLTALEDNGIRKPVSRVTLLVDDDNALTAGDDTGVELVADCPHATQEMVNSLLASLKGYQYRAYRADDASLDPAAELGDGVTVGGIYSVVSQISEDGSGYSGITAPGEAEMEDEFPSGGPMTQSFNRKIAATRSMIIKTAEEIRLEVADDVEKLYASISITTETINSRIDNEVEGLHSEITQTATSITTRIDNEVAGLSSQISQTESSINTRIDNEVEGLSSSISQTTESINTRINNEVKGLRSEITQTADSITTRIDDEVEGLSSEISQTKESLTASITATDGRVTSLTADLEKIETRVEDTEGNISTLTQTANSLQTQVTNNKSDISDVKQYAESITLSVSNGSTSSTVTLKAGNTTLSSQTINMNGLVTFTGLANGTTTIDGDCIKTGFISADRLSLTGSITFGDLDYDSQDYINDAYSIAVDAETVANDAYAMASENQLPRYIKSTYIDEVTIRSPTIETNEFRIYSDGEEGGLSLYGYWLGGYSEFFRIEYSAYSDGGFPAVTFEAPSGGRIIFYDHVDFFGGATIHE